LVHLIFIWCIWYAFGTFFQFWYYVPRKIWQPWSLDSNGIDFFHVLRSVVYFLQVTLVSWKESRVTRLGDCSPIGLLITLGSFLENYRSKLLGYFFPRQQLCINIGKHLVGLHFGRFFYKLHWSPWWRQRGRETEGRPLWCRIPILRV
jgi:hypothetical protein